MRFSMRRTLLSTGLFLAVSLGLALAASGAAAAQTRGGTSCDQWLADDKNNGWEIVADHFWLLGYLSGLAVGLDDEILSGTTNEAIYDWMNDYCAGHPLEGIAEAAQVFAREQMKEKRKPKQP